MNGLAPYGMPTGVDPRIWRKSVAARLDELLDQAMNLITALDAMEVDPDLEPDLDDEPGTWPQGDFCRAFDSGESEDKEDDGTAEPGLGAPETRNAESQGHWWKGRNDGREVDDDFEPSIGSDEVECDGNGYARADDEPVMGWTEAFNQEAALAVSPGWHVMLDEAEDIGDAEPELYAD